MKIGIITLSDSKDNYGQILQCWALQEYLRKEGHDPFLIKFTAERVWSFQFIWIIKILLVYPLIRKMLHRFSQHKNKAKYDYIERRNECRQFNQFKSLHIKSTEFEYHTISQLINNPPQAECYITGSDQVWSQALNNPNNQAYFLNFGKKEVKRISYAPSFGMKIYPACSALKLKMALSKIDFISVRENDGVEICKSVGYAATKVLDPTLLLNKNNYFKLLSKSFFQNNDDYVYIYSLNIRSSKEMRWDELSSYVKQQNLDVIVTPASGYFIGLELFGNNVKYDYATIEKWLYNIANTNLMVTTSFHGVVFSILLETPFVYIPLKGVHAGGNNRIYDLLHELNLNNRVLTDEESYQSITAKKIDWTSVREKLKRLRVNSIDFLTKSLG